VPIENLRLSSGVSFAHYEISGVPGLDDRTQWVGQSTSFDARYRFIDRDKAGFGFAIDAEPSLSRVGDPNETDDAKLKRVLGILVLADAGSSAAATPVKPRRRSRRSRTNTQHIISTGNILPFHRRTPHPHN
jgi:hypothetical protein